MDGGEESTSIPEEFMSDMEEPSRTTSGFPNIDDDDIDDSMPPTSPLLELNGEQLLAHLSNSSSSASEIASLEPYLIERLLLKMRPEIARKNEIEKNMTQLKKRCPVTDLLMNLQSENADL